MQLVKRNIYISLNQQFIQKQNDAYLIFIVVAPFLFFSLASMVYSAACHDNEVEGRIRGIIIRTIDGLSHMDASDMSISLVVSISVTIVMAYVSYLMAAGKKIVIELWFDDQQKELKVISGNSRGDTFTNTVKYSDISYTYSHQSDGLRDDVYGVITIGNKIEQFGSIYKNHFTWSTTEYKEIEYRLKMIRQTRLY